jgi:ketosteroid isomerase-like protein
MAISEYEVRTLFTHLGSENPEPFFDHVAADVYWMVLGTHPLAGEYSGKQNFREHAFDRLAACFEGPFKLYVREVLVAGDRAAVELYTIATARNGVRFNNAFCWICEFEEGKITGVRAYLDSALVQQLLHGGTTATVNSLRE